MGEPVGDAHTAWEEHYSAKPQVWSGRVNARLAEVAPALAGTRALDLGCGEGADAIWLAEHGWTVVAVDVSTTALARAREAATSGGVADCIDFVEHDLTCGLPGGSFDLVSAQFLHSAVAMDRSAVLRRAAAAVAPGGTLLIVDHAAAPPWASRLHHHEFPTADALHQTLEVYPHACFTVLLGQSPFPKYTLEGRIQRQLILYELKIGVSDPMRLFEEITRHRLINGILPLDALLAPGELDALVAAYTACLAATEPGKVTALGHREEGQVVLPVGELKMRY